MLDPSTAFGPDLIVPGDVQPAARATADEPTPAPRRTTVASEDSAGGGDCSITVNSIPWSEVWIDGKNTGRHTPIVDEEIGCGAHRLDFRRPDLHIAESESIVVRPGQPFKHRYTLAGGAD